MSDDRNLSGPEKRELMKQEFLKEMMLKKQMQEQAKQQHRMNQIEKSMQELDMLVNKPDDTDEWVARLQRPALEAELRLDTAVNSTLDAQLPDNDHAPAEPNPTRTLGDVEIQPDPATETPAPDAGATPPPAGPSRTLGDTEG